MDARTEQLTHQIIAAAMQVHRMLGPGQVESAYETCLMFELIEQGLVVQRHFPIGNGQTIDLLVENEVILELIAVNRITQLHHARLYSSLERSGCRTGLLINFNVSLLKEGIIRILTGFREEPIREKAS